MTCSLQYLLSISCHIQCKDLFSLTHLIRTELEQDVKHYERGRILFPDVVDVRIAVASNEM